ncbi:MAG: L-aspartate oxidase, partial [Pseudomonadota bacterium]
GEAASTGLHGANRLASNSLLEAAVYGARIAEDIGGIEPPRAPLPALAPPSVALPPGPGRQAPVRLVAELRRVMTDDVGVERDAAGLRRALARIAAIEAEGAGTSRAILNMTTAATLIAAAALEREESRGGHFRSDFPEADPARAARTEMRLAEALALRSCAVAGGG